jgi:hypothetical protein
MAATFFFGQFPTGEHQGGKETEIDVGGLEMGGIGLSEMPNQGAVAIAGVGMSRGYPFTKRAAWMPASSPMAVDSI